MRGAHAALPLHPLTHPRLSRPRSRAEILVAGMTCSHCASSVSDELNAIDGVDGVTVDLNAGGASRVIVHSAAPIDPTAVRAAVEEAGYTLATSPI